MFPATSKDSLGFFLNESFFYLRNVKISISIILFFLGCNLVYSQDSTFLDKQWFFKDSLDLNKFRIIDSLTLSNGSTIFEENVICREWRFKSDSIFEESLLDLPDPLSEMDLRSWKRTGIKPPQSRAIIGYSKGNWSIEQNILSLKVNKTFIQYAMKMKENKIELVRIKKSHSN